MKRRTMLGALGASAAGLATIARASDAKIIGDEPAHRHDAIHKECLDACSDCARMCDETFHHCYVQVAEGKRDHAKSLHLVSDCEGFCSLSASMIAKHSPLMAASCMACAEACKMTAAEVEKFDQPEMKAAAKALRRCVTSCNEMVKAMGGHDHDHKEAPSAK